MRSMKTAGFTQVKELRRRAIRLYAMDRIDKEDADQIVLHCDSLLVIISQMEEREELPYTPRLGDLRVETIPSN
jgi:hypothetical protein